MDSIRAFEGELVARLCVALIKGCLNSAQLSSVEKLCVGISRLVVIELIPSYWWT